jgi:Fe-S-cluster containining protein
MVPLSVPEAFRLRDDVSALPAGQRRSVQQSCLAAAKKILEAVPQDFAGSEPAPADIQTHTSRLGGWYAGLRLPCPFLSDGLCTSYQTRPIACREHLVTGSAALCRGDGADEPSVAPAPVSVLECLGRLAAELEQSEPEAVMLPLALPWAQENISRSRRTWPATAMVERFIEILTADERG